LGNTAARFKRGRVQTKMRGNEQVGGNGVGSPGKGGTTGGRVNLGWAEKTTGKIKNLGSEHVFGKQNERGKKKKKKKKKGRKQGAKKGKTVQKMKKGRQGDKSKNVQVKPVNAN